MPTVCILYGFSEGPRVGRRFRAALKAKGYSIITDPAQADILITHSGGCLLLPDKIQAKQIIHIAPYQWPGKSWFACMSRKLLDDIHAHHREGELHFWARKTFWNFVYFWKMANNFRMQRTINQPTRWRYGNITTVLRPRHDTFCTPDYRLLPFKPSATFISMPGYHDDCWRNPKPYVDLLKTGKM